MSNRFDRLKNRIKAGAKSSASKARAVKMQAQRGIERAIGKRSCIAITGFSGAGKSTLLASLVNQLINMDVQQAKNLWPDLQSRWLSAALIESDASIANYPYANHIQQLRDGKWPVSTETLSRCLIEIRLKPRSRFEDISGKGYVSHQLEIWDYPGEWLMDLPLATMSYEQWVADSYVHFNNEPRNIIAPELYKALLDIDPASPFDSVKFEQLFDQYQQFLLRCKNQGLHIINPGRFALATADKYSLPAFIPLLAGYQNTIEVRPNSWAAEMQTRYQHYVAAYVKPFLTNVFEQVDHQLVLVDLLGSLSLGKSCLEELRRSLARVLQLFSYGRNGWLDKLIAPKVERLTFIASKLDCVLPSQRNHLAELMRAVVAESVQAARFESTEVEHLELAAVACTQTGKRNEQPALYVQNGETLAWLSHPNLPRGWPTDTDWRALADWHLPLLSPPNLPDPQLNAWPNIHMAQLCEHLLREVHL